ncbi:sulfotransferase [Paraneptunicella aestuarii]|uniref:tetratricopeptide repeat-containing sulfotransferase family protein n=1 Tax=Paraneptunicella aestuarii TaxID=2831148 RepID=UPI001E33C502|nr:sulfotransferase [Paraneptunicella aestuarii]UAA37775.1 sulfotransferase [Paraneptunicella aestuarii]
MSAHQIQSWVNQALQYQKRGRFAEAEAMFNQVQQLDNRHPEINHLFGLMYYQAGRFDQALQKIQKAIKVAPKDAKYRNSMGMVLRKLGRIDNAIKEYHKASSLEPGYPDPLVNLGNLYISTQQYPTAIEHLQKALFLQNQNPGIHLNLGNAYRGMKDWALAEECYVQALKLDPNYGIALYNLALVQKQGEKQALALTTVQSCLDKYPDYVAALMLKGELLEHLGETDNAIEAYLGCLAVRADHCPVYWSLANIGKYRFSDEDMARMEALVQQEFSVQDKSYLYFALAKAYEQQERFTESFAMLVKGNQLKRSLIHYSGEQVHELVQVMKRVFTAGDFDLSFDEGGNVTPVFIIGMPRSGTSLIEQILASHPAIVAGGERETALELYYDKLPAWANTNAINAIGKIKAFVPQAEEFYLQQNQTWIQDSHFFTDKLPFNFMFVGMLATIFPNARFVHIYKHPIDSCFSCYKQLFSGPQEFSYDQQELAQFYADYRDIMKHWNSVLPNSIINLSYEQLVDDMRNEAERVLKFLGLQWHDDCYQFNTTKRVVSTASSGQVREPLYRSAIARWKYYEMELQPLIHELQKRRLLSDDGQPLNLGE